MPRESITIPPECMPSAEARASLRKPAWRDRLTAWCRSLVRATSWYVVTFIDGDFESISEPFATKHAAALYSRGFVSGAGKLSVTSVRAFVLPDERSDMLAWALDTRVDPKPALAAMAAALESP